MAQTTGNNLPPPQEPFVDPATGNLSSSGYQYLLSVINQANTNQATATVGDGLVATGTNQATALQLSDQWNEVDTVAAGTGVILSAFGMGQSQLVSNQGANALLVYPPPGLQINALAVNQAFSLGAGSTITFGFFSATQIRS